MNEVEIQTPVMIDGKVYTKASGILLSQAVREQGEKDYARAVAREGIRRESGDAETREGVMSDLLAVSLIRFCDLIEKLAQAKTVEHVREAASEQLEFVRAIKAVEMPFKVKGLSDSTVIADYAAVSNAVNAVIKKAKA